MSEMNGAKKDLIVVDNVGRRCAHRTPWADELSGVIDLIQSRAAFTVSSPDLPAIQSDFAKG